MKTYQYITTFVLALLLVLWNNSESYAAGCGVPVITSCSPSAGGKITSSSCTYTAVPNIGYAFSYWKIAGETGSGSISAKTKTANPYTIEGSYDSLIAIYGGELTLTAYFKKVTTYTITWKNWDGTVLKTTTVNANSTPTYTGSTPTRTSTAQYTYTFKGWTPAITAATANKTYTATYTQTTRKYTITWKNSDGTTLKTEQVAYGATPSYNGSTPTKDSTAQYTYNFSGWTPSITAVTANKTYTATYTQTLRNYTINVNTSKVSQGTAAGGGTYDYGTNHQISATPNECYRFTQWSDGNTDNPRTITVTGNATYTAEFEQIQYTIEAQSADGMQGSASVTTP